MWDGLAPSARPNLTELYQQQRSGSEDFRVRETNTSLMGSKH